MRAMFLTLVAGAWLLAAAPAAPHHSFAAVFDISRPIEIEGTVTRLNWTNPHAWIYIDVADDAGNVENWSIELLGINTLLKQGWRPNILKPGDRVRVEGYGARDGGPSGNASVFTIVDTGEQLWVSETRRE